MDGPVFATTVVRPPYPWYKVGALPPRATLQDHADQLESAAERVRQRANGWAELWQQYRTRPSYIEVLDDDRAAATFQEHVLRRTRHELAGLQVRPARTPGTRPKIVPGFFEAAERGVQFKVVYGVSVLRAPLGLSSVQQCITHGEDARVFPDIPLNLRISDGRVAIMTAPDDSAGGRRSTVGRRVARLQELLGAHSRFQLGSQAVRRGWI